MSNIKKHRFNLVEITLAIAILAIGMGSILVLFPVGVNSHKEAIANNNLSDISEYILGSVEAKVLADWAHSSQSASGYNINDLGTINALRSNTVTFLKNLATGKPEGKNIKPHDLIKGHHIAHNDSDSESDTKKADLYAKFFKTNVDGVFLYEQATVVNNERIEDFSAVVMLWKENVSLRLSNGSVGTISNHDYAVSLNLEVSWPAEADYDNREKRFYKLNLYNPYYQPATPNTP